VAGLVCRACGGQKGQVVLDLGDLPASDYFPRLEDPGPDPRFPLEMWLCSVCALAQLVADPTVPEEPRGNEPEALVAQARDAVNRVFTSGMLRRDSRVAEYGSPHGGSWLGLLASLGCSTVPEGEAADVVLDCFGLMHAADQHAALAERADRVAAGGVLLLQYHALDTIIRARQWNAVRHGHYAYYSTTALVSMLADHGFSPRTAWVFDLYRGTVLLATYRMADHVFEPDDSVQSLLANDADVGVRDPAVLRGLGYAAQIHAAGLHEWFVSERNAGSDVLGYGAASRAVALLCKAGVDRSLLRAVVDASPVKEGLRMPGTDVPIVSPAELFGTEPVVVLVFVSDLLAEVRSSYPEVEAAGGRWVDVETLGLGDDGV
jgi:hypothetical protein